MYRKSTLYILVAFLLSLFCSCDMSFPGETTTVPPAFEPPHVLKPDTPLSHTEQYSGECESLREGELQAIENGGLPDGFILDPVSNICHVQMGETFNTGIQFHIISTPEYKANALTAHVTVSEPDVLRIQEVNEEALFQGLDWGAITVETLQAGVAHVYITVTHTPTGGSHTYQFIFVVNTPAETAE